MEPFKNLLNAGTVGDARRQLARAWSGFDGARFEALALDGLDALEFKARAQHLCHALEATLPADFDQACGVIEASLRPLPPGASLAELRSADDGLAGWIVWPLSEFVARRGLGRPERALQALHALTQRFTAEWAIRPFIVEHPALAFATLRRWCEDPSEHVRRLVSEGSRPRLPWGLQLRALVADPAPTLPLLAALQDDPSAYVRRSVANHLNDIAKDHPAIVAQWLEAHLPDAPPARRALLRHASRTLVKRGDARVLAAWGLGQRFEGEAALAVTPKRLDFGHALTLTVTLRSTAARPQPLVIDYALHHRKADGSIAPKVFKGWSLTLAPGETRRLEKRHAIRPITTRRYHAGAHEVDLRLNGEVHAAAGFVLRMTG